MTESEKQVIIDAVLSALRTNSRTIEQLTPVASLSASDYFEVNGGRKIAYTVLANLIATLSESEQSNLQAAIDRKELQSVAITTTQSSATLTIKSVGKTISCSIPIASSSQSGIITATDKVKLDSAYSNADSALTQAKAAQTTANNAKNAAETANAGVAAINNKIGMAGGIVPLDGSGKVPSRFIPDALDDVKEFGSIVTSVSITPSSSLKNSTDDGCMVVYNSDTNTFLLAVANTAIIDSDWRAVDKKLIFEQATPVDAPALTTGLTKSDLWQVVDGFEVQLVTRHFTYYNNWADSGLFGQQSINGIIPASDKQYLNTSTNSSYRWSGSKLVCTGSDLTLGHTANTAFPGDEGEKLQKDLVNLAGEHSTLETKFNRLSSDIAEVDMGGVKFIDLNAVCDNSNPYTNLGEALPSVPDRFRAYGAVVRLWIEKEDANGNLTEKWETYQWAKTPFDDDADWEDASQWEPFGSAGSADGNCLNVTVEIPKTNTTNPYYDLGSAIAAVFSKDRAKLGLQITFAATATSWKQYQYIGSTLDVGDFCNEKNWIDLAGLSAGDETIINVNNLVEAPNEIYTLSLAINALIKKENETKITYRKNGLILIYRVAEDKFEMKQFVGSNPNDIKPTDTSDEIWHDVGGGGNVQIKTTDTPSLDSEDAFSAQGAYKHIPKNIRKDEDTPGVVKLALINDVGEDVGDEIQFSVGTGTGGGGTIVAIDFKNSPLYAQAGGRVVIEASIISLTKVGSNEQTNAIETVQLIDRATKQPIETWNVKQPSSPSAGPDKYSFSFDVSSYFTVAASREFQLRVTDDSGNVGIRSISVIAVDLTIKSEQTLNYTASTSLNVSDSKASGINCYSFPNFTTEIKAVEEIFIDGEWHVLATKTIKNNRTNMISINPSSCCGIVLKHGAYPIRIHGVDEKSGVTGSYLHSTVMVIDRNSSMPLIATRWISDGAEESTVKLYEDIAVDYAVYFPGATTATAEIWYGLNGQETMQQLNLAIVSETYRTAIKVADVEYDGSQALGFYVKSGAGTGATSQKSVFRVNGTLVDVADVPGKLFSFNFAGRSNDENNHEISSNGVTIDVVGANWRTNGFVRDSFGTENYGQEGDTGVMTLRIAENVKATLNFAPFADESIETNGMAFQWKSRPRNMADPTAVLVRCIHEGYGFYQTGEKVVFTTDNEATQDHTIEVMLKDDKEADITIVMEPTRLAPYGGIGVVRMFVNGDEAGACSYVAGSLKRHSTKVTMDGTFGELYMYDINAWPSFFGFIEAFNSSLLRKNSTADMISEHQFNDVFSAVEAEGTTEDRPTISALQARGLATLVVCKNAGTANTDDQYPEYLETLDGDKKTKRTYDWYLTFPFRPWQDCKIIGLEETNQGTTSSWEKIKNIKGKLKKAKIILLHAREEFEGDPYALAMYDECAKNAANGRIQIFDESVPTNIATIKVDIQDASGANNGAMMQMFNELQRALGSEYLTPAQNAYTGKYTLNTSIDSLPIAYFRTDRFSPDATSPTYGYFHCKGNFNQDKGDAKVFGFEDVEGYNKGCLNYGEFLEHVAPRDTADFDTYAVELDKSEWESVDDDGNDVVHMVSEFCGPKYHFYRFKDGAWADTTGTMRCTNFGAVQQMNAKPVWKIEGDVLNPTEVIEMRKYDGFCWLQGCDSVDDLLVLSDGAPIWLQYFESRYPNDDALNDLYESGKKIPWNLYNTLRFFQDCNHRLDESHGDITLGGKVVAGTRENRLKKFLRELHNIASVKSSMCYKGAIHYPCSADQESKNSMMMWSLEPDGTIKLRWNPMYDGDNQWGLGNNSAYTVSVTVNMDIDEGIYQGWDSVLFKNMLPGRKFWLDDNGATTITIEEVVKAMREATLPGGLKPFSPAGIEKYWVEDRLSKWPVTVSSYDGERKYVRTATSTYNKMYGLHGLGIDRLRQFVATRFELCDGYFGVGDIYNSTMKMRATGKDIKIRLRAGKDGYFGVGVDQAGNSAIDGAYLKAGESIELHTGVTNTAGGMLITIFGANKIEMLDLSEATPSQNNWNLGECIMLKELILGGEGWTGHNNTEGFLKTLDLGNKPFLERLDIRGTHINTFNATYCPRLNTVLAGGSELTGFTVAATSPLAEFQLPISLQTLRLSDLPQLSYKGIGSDAGLQIEALPNVSALILANVPKINVCKLLGDVLTSQSGQLKLSQVGITDSPLRGNGADLLALVDKLSGKPDSGIDGSLRFDKPVIKGDYQLVTILEVAEIERIENGIQGITISIVVEAFIDTIDQLNGDYFSGDPEVSTVTLDNIGEHILYYNGELYKDYLDRLTIDNESIHNVITK